MPLDLEVLIFILSASCSDENLSSVCWKPSTKKPSKTTSSSKKQRCNSKAPELDTLLALAASSDPNHENQEQDQQQRVA